MFGSKELAPVPGFIVDFATNDNAPRNAETDTMGTLLEVGSRNDVLTSLAGTMRHKGATGDQIYAALRAINATSTDPLGDEEVRSIAYGMERYAPGVDQKPTEQNIALCFANEYAGQLAFNPEFSWLYYRDGVWVVDQGGLQAQEAAKNMTWRLAERFYEQSKNAPTDEVAKKLQSAANGLQRASFIQNVRKLARSNPQINIAHEEFDEELSYLNLTNTTYDLANHVALGHSPEQYATMQANVSLDPDAKCPNLSVVI